MSKVLLLCDLDNTLIHSRHKAKPGDVCVGMLDNKRQDFVSPVAYELLRTLPADVQLVPVTSRSAKQYRRIEWPNGAPHYAIVACGATLLIDGKESATWASSTNQIIAQYHEELLRLKNDLGFHLVDCSYATSKMNETYVTYLPTYNEGRRVTVLPPGIGKGHASKALMSMLPHNVCIAAGDGPLDMPMLRLADIAIVPDSPMFKLSLPNALFHQGSSDFASFILKTAKRYI